MHVIKDNPYRILGVLSNSSTREIVANQGKIKAFTKTGKSVSYPYDLVNILGQVDRTEDSLAKAVNAISLPKDKLTAGFFWFMSLNSLDEIALNNLCNDDIEKAIDVFRKKRTISACINIAILNLIAGKWTTALYYYIQLLESTERRNELLSIIADNTAAMTESEVVELFVNCLRTNFPAVDWLSESLKTSVTIGDETAEIGGFMGNSNVGRYIKQISEGEVVSKLNKLIDDCQKDKSNAKINLERAEKLKKESHILLHSLKLILGKSDTKYQTLADKVANGILNLCIAYYNQDENNSERARNVLSLTKAALRIAEGKLVQDRCKENLAIIQEAYDALPPESVKEEFAQIEKERTVYNRLNQAHRLLDFVMQCGRYLGYIKEKLGENNPAYIKKSSDIVTFALNIIIDEVNQKQKEYNDAPHYLDVQALGAYKSSLKWAKSIIDVLDGFAMNDVILKRYNENKNTLNRLYQKHFISSIPTTPLTSTRVTPPYNISSKTPQNKEESKMGCVIAITIAFVVITIIYLAGGSAILAYIFGLLTLGSIGSFINSEKEGNSVIPSVISFIVSVSLCVFFVFQSENDAENDAYEKIIATHSIGDYENFLTKYPNNEHYDEILDKVFIFYENKGPVELENFASKYRENVEIYQKAKNRVAEICDSLYLEAAKIDTEESWKNYINIVPAEHLNNSMERLEELRNTPWNTEDNAWETACKYDNQGSYERYLELYPSGVHKKQAEKKIVDKRVDSAFAGEHGDLPQMNQVRGGGGPTSHISIENQTDYTLTLLYSGPSSQSLSIPSHSTKSITLSNGSYRVAAYVSSSSVNSYTGREELKGGSYEASYYIITY